MTVFKEKHLLCTSGENPSVLFALVVGEEEKKDLEEIILCLKEDLHQDFALLAYAAEDWDRDLSPWEALPVFGDRPFGGGAATCLKDLLSTLDETLPDLYCTEDTPVILGGYSLAGLFALWAPYQTDRFQGITAASPSVWFPGWIEYVSSHSVHTEHIYLSLGDKEEKTRNRVMSTVGDRIRKCHEMYSDGRVKSTTLEFNPGNHFRDPGLRTAKGLLWTARQILEET